MILIVGLGNPGKSYLNTRHNLGFSVIERIKEIYDFPEFKRKHKGLFSKKNIFFNDVLLLKPSTFMNLSGESVESVIKYYKIDLENIIVFQDDLDLYFGKIRIKVNGGHGGHNGIRNIISKIGGNFNRIKVGIKRDNINAEATTFVLNNFNEDEKKKIDILVNLIVDKINLLINKEFNEFMNKIKV